MKKKIILIFAIILVISSFYGCSKDEVNITLDEIVKANSYDSLIKEYGTYKLEYNYGSKNENFIEYIGTDGVLKLINNNSAYIYYGEKCCYYEKNDEIYALLKNYDEGKSYRNIGNILEIGNELYHEELKEITRTDDGYAAVCVLNGENVELEDGQKLTSDDEIVYTMTLNKKLTVTALTATVKYATLNDDSTEEISDASRDTEESTSENSGKIVDLEEETKTDKNLGYERRLYSLTFEDSVDEDFEKFEPYTVLKKHANPDSENTVSVTVFENGESEGKIYFCTKGDKMYVSNSGYYKDEARKELCSDNFVTVNENISIYL